MTSKTKGILLGSVLAVLITIAIFDLNYKSNPTLVQDTFPASTEQKFIYENSGNGTIVEVSNDSSYFELRTRFGDVQLTDIGTQKEIDSLRPLRAKDIVKTYNKYQEFLNK
jgi:hypothetical protein